MAVGMFGNPLDDERSPGYFQRKYRLLPVFSPIGRLGKFTVTRKTLEED